MMFVVGYKLSITNDFTIVNITGSRFNMPNVQCRINGSLQTTFTDSNKISCTIQASSNNENSFARIDVTNDNIYYSNKQLLCIIGSTSNRHITV